MRIKYSPYLEWHLFRRFQSLVFMTKGGGEDSSANAISNRVVGLLKRGVKPEKILKTLEVVPREGFTAPEYNPLYVILAKEYLKPNGAINTFLAGGGAGLDELRLIFRTLDWATKIAPEDKTLAGAHFFMGIFFVAQGDFESALDRFESSQNLEPRLDVKYDQLLDAVTSEDQNQVAKVLGNTYQSFAKALQGAGIQSWLLGETRKVPKPTPVPTPIPVPKPEVTPEALKTQADDAAFKGNHEKAVRLYQKILSTDPENIEIKRKVHACANMLIQLADKALEIQDFDTTERELNLALEILPENALAIGLLGLVYYRKDNISQARACLVKALELDPNLTHPRILYDYALILFYKEKYKEAYFYLTKVKTEDEMLKVLVLLNQGIVSFHLKNFDGAERTLEEVELYHHQTDSKVKLLRNNIIKHLYYLSKTKLALGKLAKAHLYCTRLRNYIPELEAAKELEAEIVEARQKESQIEDQEHKYSLPSDLTGVPVVLSPFPSPLPPLPSEPGIRPMSEADKKRVKLRDLSILAEIQISKGELFKAADIYHEIFKIDPENEKAKVEVADLARKFFGVGKKMQREKKHEEAMKYFEAVLKITEDMEAKAELAFVYQKTDRYIEAVEMFKHILPYYEKLEEMYPDRKYIKHRLAFIYYHLGMRNDQRREALEILKENREDKVGLEQLGYSFFAIKEPLKAYTLFKHVINSIDAESSPALKGLAAAGKALTKKEKDNLPSVTSIIDEALEEFEALKKAGKRRKMGTHLKDLLDIPIPQEDKNIEKQIARLIEEGEKLLQEGRKSNALDKFLEARNLNPENSKVKNALDDFFKYYKENAQRLEERGDLQGAKSACEKALLIYSDNPEILEILEKISPPPPPPAPNPSPPPLPIPEFELKRPSEKIEDPKAYEKSLVIKHLQWRLRNRKSFAKLDIKRENPEVYDLIWGPERVFDRLEEAKVAAGIRSKRSGKKPPPLSLTPDEIIKRRDMAVRFLLEGDNLDLKSEQILKKNSKIYWIIYDKRVFPNGLPETEEIARKLKEEFSQEPKVWYAQLRSENAIGIAGFFSDLGKKIRMWKETIEAAKKEKTVSLESKTRDLKGFLTEILFYKFRTFKKIEELGQEIPEQFYAQLDEIEGEIRSLIR